MRSRHVATALLLFPLAGATCVLAAPAGAAAAPTSTVRWDDQAITFVSTGALDNDLRITVTDVDSPADPALGRRTWTFTDRAPITPAYKSCRHPSPEATNVVACSVDYTIGNEIENIFIEVHLGPGNDRVVDGNGLGYDTFDRLYGEDGNDRIVTSRNAEIVDGGAGNDVLTGSDRYADFPLLHVNGGAGADRIDVADATVEVDIAGGTGNDTIDGGRGPDRIFGNSGDDRVTAGPGNDTVSGGDGRDTLYGNSGNDTLTGGAGVDTISGGPGRNTIRQ